jgi:hypothetical protein
VCQKSGGDRDHFAFVASSDSIDSMATLTIRVPGPKFVQPGCTATTNRIQVGEMLVHEGVEAYKKEGPKFMQRLVAKQKARVKDS